MIKKNNQVTQLVTIISELPERTVVTLSKGEKPWNNSSLLYCLYFTYTLDIHDL